MAATTLSFSKVGNVWVATTDALGNMIIQIKRNADGRLNIEQYIDGMDPMPCKDVINQDANLLIPFSSAKGLKLKITSSSEVTKAMIMEAVFGSASSGGAIPGNILTNSDIINVLTSDATNKVLSAAQGKALKALIDAKVIPEIVNALTSDETNKALSAAQGKALKTLIDAKVIPIAATTAKAGLVKKMAAVTKPADDTPANIKASLEQLIDAAKTALMME